MLLLVALTPVSQAGPPASKDCERALGAQPAGESLDFAKRCPAFTRWLEETGYAQTIRPGVAAVHDRAAARDMLALFELAPNQASTGPVDRAGLERIVADIRRDPLNDDDTSETSWLADWLKDQLGRIDWTTPPWVDDWLEGLGDVARGVVLLVYLAIAVALLAVIAWLIKQAIERWMPGLAHGPTGTPAAGAGRSEFTPSQLPVRQQPGALLKRVIEDWRRRGQLPSAPGRTNSELADSLIHVAPAQRQPFRRLATMAEISRYAGRSLTAAELQRCFDDADTLADTKADRR